MNVVSFFFIIIISRDEAEKTVTPSESILPTIYQCQTCGREHQENSMVCFPCHENELMDGEIENNNTFLNQQVRLPCYLINNSVTVFFIS